MEREHKIQNCRISQIIAGSELIMQKFLGILRNSAQFVATHSRRAFRNGGAGSRLKKNDPPPPGAENCSYAARRFRLGPTDYARGGGGAQAVRGPADRS